MAWVTRLARKCRMYTLRTQVGVETVVGTGRGVEYASIDELADALRSQSK